MRQVSDVGSAQRATPATRHTASSLVGHQLSAGAICASASDQCDKTITVMQRHWRTSLPPRHRSRRVSQSATVQPGSPHEQLTAGAAADHGTSWKAKARSSILLARALAWDPARHVASCDRRVPSSRSRSAARARGLRHAQPRSRNGAASTASPAHESAGPLRRPLDRYIEASSRRACSILAAISRGLGAPAADPFRRGAALDPLAEACLHACAVSAANRTILRVDMDCRFARRCELRASPSRS